MKALLAFLERLLFPPLPPLEVRQERAEGKATPIMLETRVVHYHEDYYRVEYRYTNGAWRELTITDNFMRKLDYLKRDGPWIMFFDRAVELANSLTTQKIEEHVKRQDAIYAEALIDLQKKDERQKNAHYQTSRPA